MSTFHASELDSASRSDLIARAEALGIEKADVLTRAELVDEIVKRMVADPLERRLARGLLGVARDLVARVVERGLHLPDAAALIRGLQQATLTPVTPPIATVTLAEIYAGQGHRDRALVVLDEVLENEPDHAAARALREKVTAMHPAAVAAEPSSPSSEPPPAPAAVEERAVEERSESPLESADAPPASSLESAAVADNAPDSVRDDGAVDSAAHSASDSEAEQEHARDTLPPSPDVSPTLAPGDLPATTPSPALRDSMFVAAMARPTELAPPFPAEIDEIVLVPLDETNALARWEVRSVASDIARDRAPEGAMILRIVAVTPSWDGPSVEVRDIEITDEIGDWWVGELPPGAVLRGAIGWRAGDTFDPWAVALDVTPRDETTSAHARWPLVDRRPGDAPASSSWRALAFAPGEVSYPAAP